MSLGLNQLKRELYEFGPFRVDAERELLLRAGESVPLTPKAFQILLTLVRLSGELVSKDEIMKAVWPDTFVEETNLTRNIFSLRKALGESPQNQYIITVSGKGYRLAERAQLIQEQEIAIVAASRSTVEVQVEEHRSSAWIWAAGLVVSVAVLVLGAIHFFSPRAPLLTEKDSIVLADFANSTGDPVFDETLRQGLAVQLEQSPFLQIISDERVQHTLKLMGRTPDMHLSASTAREVCERIGATALLEGSIASVGTLYVLGLRATNCSTGDVLAEEQAKSATKEQVLDALSDIAVKFRSRVGESLSTIRQHDKPLEEATTSSLDALKAYSLGVRVAFTDSFVAAVPLLKRAIELDPKFALAYGHLGLMYAGSGQPELSATSAKSAYELRDRVSDREQFFLSVIYDRVATGNLERAQQTCALWAQSYPRDPLPHALSSGAILQATGKFESSIKEGERAIALDPDLSPAYVNLGFSYFSIGRVKEAEDTIRRASERGFNMPESLLLRYYIANVKNDQNGMSGAVALAQGRAWAEDWITHAQALAAARAGQLRLARNLSRKAVDLARSIGQLERAAGYEAAAAEYQARIGNTYEAKRLARAALEISRGRDTEFTAALALGSAGDLAKAEELRKDLASRFPEDTVVRRTYLPALSGLLAIKRKDPGKAIEQLQVALSEEMALVGNGFAVLGNVDSTYVRGEAYLSGGHGKEAATEFQKLLDRPGIVFDDPAGSLAHLQIGRSYASVGDWTKARSAYQDFLHLWEDADPEVPILRQAKAEFVRLQ
jgi:DNA-binding winged helix-turn-helix (wHTH) protein/predicted Zn-dependent protease